MSDLQQRVYDWVEDVLGTEGVHDVHQRHCRFLEEALELCQAAGGTKEDALLLVEYVFSRPTGTIEQELGGTHLTLLALANATHYSLEVCGETELKRCNTPEIKAKVKLKYATRQEGGVLPGIIDSSLATDEISR